MYQKTIELLVCVSILTCLGTLNVSAAGSFQDILNVPATKSPMAKTRLFNDITSIGKRLVCVGQFGTILYSDDNGKSWEQASVPVSTDLVAVHFPTTKKGWAVGHDGVVLHSSDAGVTWIKQFDSRSVGQTLAKFYAEHPPKNLPGGDEALELFMSDVEMFNLPPGEGSNKSFLDVFFVNENDGFIVGTFGLIFRTADGGISWDPWLHRTDNTRILHMYSIEAIGNEIFIAGEQGLIMKLDRESLHFREIKTPYSGTYFGLIGKPGIVIAFGMRGNVYRSIDNGDSWEKIEAQVSGPGVYVQVRGSTESIIDKSIQSGITGATIIDDGSIILVSQGGDLLLSKNNGKSFKALELESPFLAAAVESIDKKTVILAGFHGLMLTSLQ